MRVDASTVDRWPARVALVIAGLGLAILFQSVAGDGWWEVFSFSVLAWCVAKAMSGCGRRERLFLLASISLPFLVIVAFVYVLAVWS